MILKLTEEHEDGSATFNVTYTKEELENMVQYAVVKMLEDSIKRMDEEYFKVGGTTDEG